MNIFTALFLGIVQGLCEFLPVSSSGHLVLFQKLLAVEEPSMSFDILLHLGTLVPVFVIFRKDIINLIKNPLQKLMFQLAVATLPAVIASLLFKDAIESLFEGGIFLAVGFIITGCFLFYADSVKENSKKLRNITYADALVIGCMQAIAIPPGISRSGSTITGALFRKLDRTTAARFSFLMSIPAILGAVVITVKDLLTGEAAMTVEPLPMIFGFVASMLTGYLAIKFMLVLIKKCKLRYFSYYVFALAAFILIDSLLTKIVF